MRRQNLYILISMLTLLLFGACSLHQEDDLFDDSSANRISEALKNCKEILIAPENGWRMKYYPASGQFFGGFNLLVSFDEKGNATIAGEISDSDDTVTSLYSLKQSAGPVLTFDSYNEIMHLFCEPVGGIGGDFEFTIMSATADKVVLSGTKSRNQIILVPMDKDREWSDYLDNVFKVQEEIFLGSFHLTVNGKEVGAVMQDYNVFTLTYSGSDVEVVTEEIPFIYTDEGLEFYQPVTIDGVTMSTFKADVEKVSFVCTDEGVNAKFEAFYPEGYRFYDQLVGTYKMGTKTVEVTANADGKTYTLTGFSDFGNVQAEYARTLGTLSINSQYLGIAGDNYYAYLCVFDSGSSYLTWLDGTGLFGINSTGDKLTITFKDNGVWGSYVANSFITYAFTGLPPSNSNADKSLELFPAPLVMEKTR